MGYRAYRRRCGYASRGDKRGYVNLVSFTGGRVHDPLLGWRRLSRRWRRWWTRGELGGFHPLALLAEGECQILVALLFRGHRSFPEKVNLQNFADVVLQNFANMFSVFNFRFAKFCKHVFGFQFPVCGFG
jgi:hypothetical protein